MKLVDKLEIYRVYSDGTIEKGYDEVAVEYVIDLVIEGFESIRLETSPFLLEELALGYAVAHQYNVTEASIVFNGSSIRVRNCVRREHVYRERQRVAIEPQTMFKIFRDALNNAELFRRTGCFHFAYASDLGGSPINFVEDISRHCALYKLIGKLYKLNADFNKIVIAMSSRASAALIESLINVGIPVAIFRGAPTNQAVIRAREGGLLLIAFGRMDKMNIYTPLM